ncbi:MAG: phosphopyruvate hydratase [Candidatus Paceibacterota bacterium]|jgi:enolase
MRLDTVIARSVADTRGRATIETTLSAGAGTATASVPSGKSTGSHEACELRDADGSVGRAIGNVNGEIRAALQGCDFASADELDALLVALDGTADKSRLGANALLSVSIAAARLFALSEDVPLWKALAKRAGTLPSAPRLYVNVMNGGAHADFKLPFQEYLLVVEGKTSEALPVAREAFAKLGERLGNVPMGDEGGYAPTFATLAEPFEVLAELVQGFPHASIALDAAASELYHDGRYHLLGKAYSADELATLYGSIATQYPLLSIEDPFAEDALGDFARLTATLGEKLLIIGDDLTVTNPARIHTAIEQKAINAVLVKPNQIGTVREAILAVQTTYAAGWQVVASHRSGETADTFIADFAYGVGAYGLKAGGLGQKERVLKYERLLTIEKEDAAS